MNASRTFIIAAAALSVSLARISCADVPLITPADPRITAALKEVSAQRIQATIQKLVSFGTRSTLSAQDPDSIKAGRGIGAARTWIKSEFEQYSRQCGGCLDVRQDTFTQQPADRIKDPTQLTNIYAVLKGTDPQAAAHIVLVTGHYDSRNSDNFNATDDAPGANDDASGTAVSLECARVLSKLKFPSTILFLTVAGEEQGLYGSRHFAQLARQQNWMLDAVLNNDIVGGNKSADQDSQVVRVFSEGIPTSAGLEEMRRVRSLAGENDSGSRELARYVADVEATYDGGVKPLLIFRVDRFLRGGDHYSFNEQGFAAIRFTEYREDFTRQHQDVRSENGIDYGDTIDHVDFDYVARVTRLNAATLASLASAPVAPANVRIITRDLDNNTTLSWDATPRAADYEVLWRGTSSAQWEHAQKTGLVTTVTLKVSKDNAIFALRALDGDGHPSLPVIPAPSR